MAEAATAIGILKYAGDVIPHCIPQEVKDKLTRPVSYVIFYGSNVEGIPTKIEQLKGVKVEVEARWLVAETNGEQIRHKIQAWLSDTDNILEKFESLESSNNNCFRGSCEIGKMLDCVEKMLDESQRFEWVSYPGRPPPIGSRYHSYNPSLLSRERLLTKILRTFRDGNINIIGVNGIPGVGKTTLLEELVKRVEINELFQVVAKVEASEKNDVKMIQTSIASRIGLVLPEQGDEEAWASSLYRQLETRLLKKERKILIIFDNICDEGGIKLERIGIPFVLEGEPSCTILLSSRRLNVCAAMGGRCNFSLSCLDMAEAKILFRDRLGNGISSDKEFLSKDYVYVENDLLRKCGGLPRAITALAQVLKVRWPDWDDVVGQLSNHNLTEVDGVAKTLHQSIKLSYDLVDGDRRKNFFLLCCLFRTGTNIAVDDLIRYGIGLNLFGRIISLEDVTQRANLWVNQLKSLSLFESTDEQGYISIHSIIQEFAISVAAEGEFLLLLDEDSRWETKENCKRYSVISMSAKSNAIHKQLSSNHAFGHLDGLESPKLEALFFEGEESFSLADGYFTGMTNLKVLGMNKMKLSTLPPSMERLKYLITLNFEDCHIQDASLVCFLVSLKVLSFRGSLVGAFPAGIGQLGDLRVLDITKCRFEIAPQDGALSRSFNHIEGLYMCGSHIDHGEANGVVTATLVDDLKYFARLNALEIEIPTNCLLSIGDLSIGVCPSRFKVGIGCKISSLREELSLIKRALSFEEIDSKLLKKRGSRALLKRAEYLSLDKISNLKKIVYDLDEDGLADLKYLHVSRCDQVECIVNSVGMAADCKILAELESLSLEKLDRLKVICHGGVPKNWCSKLRKLRLSYLRALMSHVLPIDHACELVVLEVKDCASLPHIFSNGRLVGVPELPCLRKLDLQRLPSLQRLWSNEEITTGSPPLFHDKINMPYLEELHLSSLNSIQKLWNLPHDMENFTRLQVLSLENMQSLEHVWSDELSQENPSFRSLKKLSLVGCEHVESLCPPRFPALLSELDAMEIASCGRFKEVIMAETTRTTAVRFTSLRTMKLDRLSSLRCFAQGCQTVDFPCLRMLILSELPRMLTFFEPDKLDNQADAGDQRMLFLNEMVFPSLEHLTVSTMDCIEEIVEDERATITFPKLKALEIRDLRNLKHIPEALWENLEEFRLHGCDSLQNLLELKSTSMISSLRNLELVYLKSLKDIPFRLLPNLQSLIIHSGLDKKYILSSSLVVEGEVLQRLEYINIERCDHLEEIVSKESDDQRDFLASGAFMFPKLKHIKLGILPNIATFSSGGYDAILPALEKVEMNSCPKLVSFSLGVVITPKLTSVTVDRTSIFGMDIDLNRFIRQQKQEFEQSTMEERADEVKSAKDDEVNKSCENKANDNRKDSITSNAGAEFVNSSTSPSIAA